MVLLIEKKNLKKHYLIKVKNIKKMKDNKKKKKKINIKEVFIDNLKLNMKDKKN